MRFLAIRDRDLRNVRTSVIRGPDRGLGCWERKASVAFLVEVRNKLDAHALRLRSVALVETQVATVVLQANEALCVSQHCLQLKHNEAIELINKVYITREYSNTAAQLI